jgi:MFS family permease
MGQGGSAPTTRAAERLYVVACAAMLVFGLVLSLPGTIIASPDVARFELGLIGRGVLVSALFAGMLTGCLLFGAVVERAGQRTALMAATAGAGGCLMLVAVAPSATALAGSLAVLGICCAGMNIASNALASELFPTGRAKRMNTVGVMAALGGLAMPLLTSGAAAGVSWRAIVAGAGALSLAVAVATSGATVPPRARGDWWGAARALTGRPGFGAVALLVMLGAANEAGIAGWTTSHLIGEGVDSRTATAVLASHWLGLIVGRLGLAGRVEQRKAPAIAVAGAAGAVCFVLFAFAPQLKLLMPFVIGVAIALIVPTALALGGDRFPGNEGALFGLLLTTAQIGGMTMPALIGGVADRSSLDVGVAVMAIASAAIAVTAWLASRPASR